MQVAREQVIGTSSFSYITEYVDLLLLGPFILAMGFEQFYNPLLCKLVGGFSIFVMALYLFFGVHGGGGLTAGSLSNAPSSQAPAPKEQNKHFVNYPKCSGRAADVGLMRPQWEG